MAGLISENDRLQTQVADRNRRMEAVEAQTLAAAALTSAAEARAAVAEVCAVTAKEARIRAEAESTKWHGVSRKFFDSFEFLGDVVTKAWIFDQCMKKPEAVSAAKILRMLVDFSGWVENLLKEIRSAFQLGDRGHEAGPPSGARNRFRGHHDRNCLLRPQQPQRHHRPEHHPPQPLDRRRYLINRRLHQRPASPTPLGRSQFRTP